MRIKQEKQVEKERLAKIKSEEKAKIAADKKADKLAKMTEEQRAAYEKRAADRVAKEEALWQREQAEGEKIYEKMQKALAEAEAKAAEKQ